MDEQLNGTSFNLIYDVFLNSITDDMYMELSESETYSLLQDLLLNALPHFEFPRFDITNYELSYIEDQDYYCGADSNYQTVSCYFPAGGCFKDVLTDEEIKVIVLYMIVEWLGTQLASIEMTRMKYSGSDFKFTSQASHLQKVLQLKRDYERQGFHLQRLYKRRKKDENGFYIPTMYEIMYDTREEEYEP